MKLKILGRYLVGVALALLGIFCLITTAMTFIGYQEYSQSWIESVLKKEYLSSILLVTGASSFFLMFIGFTLSHKE